MSKQMTPCEKLGYKVGDKFKASKSGAWFNVGEEVELGMDDGSNYPFFFNARMPKDSYGGRPLHIESVEKISNAKLKPAKQALADAIHQNGGWRGCANWACQHGLNRMVVFSASGLAPTRNAARGMACWNSGDIFFGGFQFDRKLPNWHQCILSRDEYFTAHPEQKVDPEMKSESEMTIKVSDWHKNGELPPVGEVCEAYIDYPPQWVETEIVAHKDGFAIGWCKSVMKGCHGDKAHEFRPLRTEREKAIDEMMGHCDYLGSRDFAGKLFDAGYRKEVK